MELRRPSKLYPGDTAAIVSLSAGTAGDAHFKWRTEQGIQRLEDNFDLRIIMRNRCFCILINSKRLFFKNRDR